MASTYRRALLNISADCAADARGGLFAAERRRENVRVLRLRAGDRAWWWVTFDTFACHWAGRAPSFGRAWIHRERQIARRVLHFTEAEVMWECCAKADEESSPSTLPPSRSFKTEKFPGGVPFRRAFARPGQSVGNAKWQTRQDVRDAVAAAIEGRDARVRELWWDVCEEFSRKELTKASNMPVIMSSLAEEFRALLPEDAYVAGLWERELPGRLLWKVEWLFGSGRMEEFRSGPVLVYMESFAKIITHYREESSADRRDLTPGGAPTDSEHHREEKGQAQRIHHLVPHLPPKTAHHQPHMAHLPGPGCQPASR